MNAMLRTPCTIRGVRLVLGCGLLSVLSWTALPAQLLPFQQKAEKKPEEKKAEPKPAVQIAEPPAEPGTVHVAFTDGGNLQMVLREDKIHLVTPHGKLAIAVADIRRIEFATRLAHEDAERIRTAVADLGSSEFAKREEASTQLRKRGKTAHPALLTAAQDKDREVARRAQELLRQIAATVPAEELVVREKDVIHTADSRIAGRIEGEALKAQTSQFGAVQVKLADLRGLQCSAVKESGATMGLTSVRDWRQMSIQAERQMKIANELQRQAEIMRQQEMMNRMKK
jgi:hypothetical protein